MNILRDPRWGRGSETWGEDPHLTSVMAAHVVQGLQGSDPKYTKVGTWRRGEGSWGPGASAMDHQAAQRKERPRQLADATAAVGL
jgi:hypothetical protein